VNRDRLKRIGLAAAYFAVVVLIIWLADHRDTQTNFSWIQALPGGDKLGHFLILGGFAFVLNHALRCRTVTLGGKPLLLGNLVVLLLATAEETSQLFIPSRTFDLLDLAADALGIWLVGRLACRACLPVKP
jgi:VanZ family protein